MCRFYVEKDSEPTVEIIKEAIETNEREKDRYEKLKNYYLGKQDILQRRRKKDINNRLVTNHCKYITDINTGYLLGSPIVYSADEGKDISKIIDAYNRQMITNLDYDLSEGCSIMGKKFELVYATKNKEAKSASILPDNAIMVCDNTIEHKELFGVVYRISRAKYNRKYEYVRVYTDKEEIIYSDGEVLKEILRTPHYFGLVPLIEFSNNKEQIGDFEPVIPLVDAYNLLQSDRLNDKEQLVQALMLFQGAKPNPEQKDELNEERTLYVPSGADVKYVTKEMNEEQIDILRKALENDIHKISMTPNLNDENFVGNSSGVAIKFKLVAFDQNIAKKERFFEQGLRKRFELYNNYLKKKSGIAKIEPHNLNITFKRNLPQNDLETSQMILNLQGLGIPQTELNAQLSFVDDPEKFMETFLKEEEDNANKGAENYGTEKPN